jgi:hypothetical protein
MLEQWRGRKIRFRKEGYAYAQMLFQRRLVGNEIILIKSIADPCISPNLWMMKYARLYRDGRQRTLTSLKNTVSQRRCFQEHMGIKLWMLESFVENVMLDFGNTVAEPEDRLIVLPRALNAIRDKEVRAVFIANHDRDPETMQRTWARSPCQEVVNEYSVEKRIDGRDHIGWYVYDPTDAYRNIYLKYVQRLEDAFGIHCDWRWLTPERAFEASRDTFLAMLDTLSERLRLRSGKRIQRMERLVKATVTAIENGDPWLHDPDTGETLFFEEQQDEDYSTTSRQEWTEQLESWASKALSFSRGPEHLRKCLLDLFRLRSECNALSPPDRPIFINPDMLLLSLLGTNIAFATMDGVKDLVTIMYAALYETAGASNLRFPKNAVPADAFIFDLKQVRNWFFHDHSLLKRKQIDHAELCFQKYVGRKDLLHDDEYQLAVFQLALLEDALDFLRQVLNHLRDHPC